MKAFAYLHALALEMQRYKFSAPELLGFMLRSLEERMGFQHSQVLALNSDANKLYHVSARGYRAADEPGELEIGRGIVGMAIKRGRSIKINNIGTVIKYTQAINSRLETEQSDESAQTQVRPHVFTQSQIALPLKFRGDTIGALSVESERPNAFDEADEELLTIIAVQLAYVLHELLTAGQTEGRKQPVTTVSGPDLEPLPAPGLLTGREMEIARLAAQGLSNAEISSRLVLSLRTVTTHLERTYRKLDIHSRSELIYYFIERYGLKPND